MKKLISPTSQRASGLTLALISLGLAACGSVLRPVVPTALSSSYQLNGSDSSASEGSSTPYACPDHPNVLPDYDTALDGSGRYSVCYAKSTGADILIHGQLALSDSLCVFPAQVVDSQHVYVKPDLNTSGPWSQCLSISSGGVYATFAGIDFNAVFIVEKQYQTQMAKCLIGGNYFGCPAYSFGRFR